jgi:predicted nucleic acid-binding Zn ribbon protein
MARKKRPRPIMERQIVEVRVGWEHAACAWCGQPFRAKRVDAKTCSDTCRFAMANERKRGTSAQEAVPV